MPEGRRGLRNSLKHAFAVDPPGAAEPTPEESRVVDVICRKIMKHGMVTPTLLGLEMSRPLNYVAAQGMHFFQPFVAALVPTGGYRCFAAFLEKRGSIEYICRRLEELRDMAQQESTAPPAEAACDDDASGVEDAHATPGSTRSPGASTTTNGPAPGARADETDEREGNGKQG